MRCLSLADELRQRGAEVFFICREHPGNLIEMIEAKGYRFAQLPYEETSFTTSMNDLAHAKWLGCSWEEDAADTINAFGDITPQWLIIDHYALDSRWECRLRPFVGRIMVIDDLADRKHECDLLLDQNLYTNMEFRYARLVPKNCQKLLGPRYALLRPEFAAARAVLRQREGYVRRILVFFGGVDPANETLKTLEALLPIQMNYYIDVVVGISNPNKDNIQAFCTKHENFHYHCQVGNIAELMAAADLAIGAGGVATWERACLGLPSLVLTIAWNQVELTREAVKQGISRYLSDTDIMSPMEIQRNITELISDVACLKSMSETGMELVDASGTTRVSEMIGAHT